MYVPQFGLPVSASGAFDYIAADPAPPGDGPGTTSWGDSIRPSWQPPWNSGAAQSQNQSGILGRLFSLLSRLLSVLGGQSSGVQPMTQTAFANAQGSSTGDPHLDFSGTTASGDSRHTHFDSMTGHQDLLDSDSFAGGYRVSTATTDPNAQGVTWNRRATVTTGYGKTQVSLDAHGNAQITRNGHARNLRAGQSIDLGNGESAVRNADGSVVVSETNSVGARIATTLRGNGNGVDVSFDAANVDLSGDLIPAH